MNTVISQFSLDTEFSALTENFSKGRVPCVATGVCDAARPLFCTAFSKEINKKLLIIMPDEREAQRLRSELEYYMENVLFFPARDFVFDNVKGYSREFEQQRIGVLSALLDGKADAVITVPDAVMQYTVPPEILQDITLHVRTGESISVSQLSSWLALLGYQRTEQVEGEGQFAVRGGIVDVFSPSYPNPFRIDFFGDEVDLIGFFDITSQRRYENTETVSILPVYELLPDNLAYENIAFHIGKQIKKFTGSEKLRDLLIKEKENCENHIRITALDKYASFVYEEKATVLDYLSDFAVIAVNTSRIKERAGAFCWQNEQTFASLAESGILPAGSQLPHMDLDTLVSSLAKKTLALDYFSGANKMFDYRDEYTVLTKSVNSYLSNLELLADDLKSSVELKRNVLVLTVSERAADNMLTALNDRNIGCYRFSGQLHKGLAGVGTLDGNQSLCGFELPRANFVLYTDTDTLQNVSARRKERVRKKVTKSERIASYADLTFGDLVVHANHGIGRFEGITNLTANGVSKDYIKIRYAGTDILYVPCNQLDLVSKYIGNENTKLSKMGTSEWQRTKARAKSAAKDIAKELIALYAARQLKEGFAFPPDEEMQEEFEAMFEYDETDDQLRAAEDIKKDMESTVPMDRLLCGDVGFGKTEVALRAAFKAIVSGKQVAVLVPTTILAMQHYQTMLSRFRAFPVKVAMMSRFRTKAEQAQTVEDLRIGKIDVVVGTHRILQSDIKFKDLGLLIIDEEQRFGVTHKEKLKQFSENIDVLTLTATPIPRTLNMALSGIRDMSVLEEAPSDRIPVQTFVLEHDDAVVHEAIRRELRRGGQVFYLHNVVETIYSCAKKLSEAFPDAVVAVAHGKMSKDELGEIWENMVRGEIDVLVSTTIIETGIDVPNANTLVIENADHMGLSQLHQLRGRVGRSARKAYAYFTYRTGSILKEIAEKRLDAIREFTEFGSGFKIAMRDLELRGAGNVLGAEQSGQMEAIGYDLYVKILEEAVEELKGNPGMLKSDCTVDMSVSAFIPEDYIPSSQMRIDVYRKIACIESEADRDDLLDELLDRFGDIPPTLWNLVRVALVRNSACACGIKLIEQKRGLISFFPEHIDVRACTLLASEPKYRGRMLLSLGGKPHFAYRPSEKEDVLDTVAEILEKFKNLLQNSVDND
ncbi:MAG: transcription-repair coupling factor [Clostridia bacterium]|nr:transcription-repair coupling factor [Clostridia bacterium]